MFPLEIDTADFKIIHSVSADPSLTPLPKSLLLSSSFEFRTSFVQDFSKFPWSFQVWMSQWIPSFRRILGRWTSFISFWNVTSGDVFLLILRNMTYALCTVVLRLAALFLLQCGATWFSIPVASLISEDRTVPLSSGGDFSLHKGES